MTEPRRFPFGGVPVYNPQSLSKTEALAQFHARKAACQSLMDLLREERSSHVLIIGTRGMGKTTLLQRVRYGVEDNAALNRRYLALAFPEEQYNVNRLHHFLLNTVDALADAVERLKNQQLLKRVEKYADDIGKRSPQEIEERVPQLLAEISQEMHKSFLLLVDNADRLFETIENRQQWQLRELLSSRRDLTFFGATTQASDGIYGPERAFFEFFKIHRLTPLTFAEVRDLLLQLSESVEEKEGEKGNAKQRVAEWLGAGAARLRTLVHLTGGNPRTTVLLFHLVLDGLLGGAREYLEQLLDQVTPNYKGRVDELPPQAQQVLDAVALRWDPVTAMEVGEDTGLETNVVSTQLTRLVRQGILEKADPGESKKALYQVAERFFNIWYLLRASRRVRAKLRWFVEFLRVFFESGELERMALDRIERYRGTWCGHPEEIETAFAYVLASGAGPDRFEKYLLQRCADSEEMWRPYFDLFSPAMAGGKRAGVGSPETRSEPGEDDQTEARYFQLLTKSESQPENAANWLKLANLLVQKGEWVEAEAAYRKAIDLQPESARAWAALAALLLKRPERTAEAEVTVRKGIEMAPSCAPLWALLGLVLAMAPERAPEAEAAFRKAIELNPSIAASWHALGRVLMRTPEPKAEAEAAFRKAIELNPSIAASWHGLGRVLGLTHERNAEAEAALRKAIELDLTIALPWHALGRVLGRSHERNAEAEAAYRKAIELDPKIASFWLDLSILLAKTYEGSDNAEAACRKAIELDPQVALSWSVLSLLANSSERAEEAEMACRKAIELDPKVAHFFHLLGTIFKSSPERVREAEAACRKAIELDPVDAYFWRSLGTLLSRDSGRAAEAEAAYRQSLKLDPTNADAWGYLGILLARRLGRPKEAEEAFRNSLRLEPDNSLSLRNLGVLLYCELSDANEAIACLERDHQLHPEESISEAIFAAVVRGTETKAQVPISIEAARGAHFWNELLDLCQNYPPFGMIILGICDLVQERDRSNRFVGLYRAVALAKLSDFPRASVALEDALTGDPIDLFSIGQRAPEVFLAAAVKSGRVRDCIELIDKKDWKDAWRPIYEALRAVEAGSAKYLMRIAVEIRVLAMVILRRIAPELPNLPEPAG